MGAVDKRNVGLGLVVAKMQGVLEKKKKRG